MKKISKLRVALLCAALIQVAFANPLENKIPWLKGVEFQEPLNGDRRGDFIELASRCVDLSGVWKGTCSTTDPDSETWESFQSIEQQGCEKLIFKGRGVWSSEIGFSARIGEVVSLNLQEYDPESFGVSSLIFAWNSSQTRLFELRTDLFGELNSALPHAMGSVSTNEYWMSGDRLMSRTGANSDLFTPFGRVGNGQIPESICEYQRES